MKQSTSERGFKGIEFKDIYSLTCSIRESSLASKPAIWFGADPNTPWVVWDKDKGSNIEMKPPENIMVRTEMHIDQEQAKAIADILMHFHEHGTLPEL